MDGLQPSRSRTGNSPLSTSMSGRRSSTPTPTAVDTVSKFSRPASRGESKFVHSKTGVPMSFTARRIVYITVVLAFVKGPGGVHAQSWQPPTDGQRCPSKWGAGDQRGSGNHMKPETVLRAAKLIRTGEVIELGHVLSASMPFFGTRRFDLHTKRT